MVSIVGQESPLDLIGKIIGDNVSQNLPGAVERGMERGIIQKGLGDISNLSPEKLRGMNPMQAIAQLLSPFAGTRQGAQYAEAIAPEFMKYIQGLQQTGPAAAAGSGDIRGLADEFQRRPLPGFGETGTAGTLAQSSFLPGMQASEKPMPTLEDVRPSLRKALGEQYYPDVRPTPILDQTESFRPAKPIKPFIPWGAEERRKADRVLFERGVTNPDIRKQMISEEEQRLKDEYQAAKAYRGDVQSYKQDRQLEDQRFWNWAQPQVEDVYGQLSGLQANIFQSIARANEEVGTDEARLRNTMQQFNQIYRDPLVNFENEGRGLPSFSMLRPDEVKSRLDNARSHIQDHLKDIDNPEKYENIPQEVKDAIKADLRDKYFTDMVTKDYGIAQASNVVYDLSEGFKEGVPVVKERERFSKAAGGVDVPLPPKIAARYVEQLSQHIAKKLKGDDSLILAREQAIANGYDEKMFNEALQLAIANGARLSNFQRSERSRLNVGQRFNISDWWDNKRSIYDLFKRKQ